MFGAIVPVVDQENLPWMFHSCCCLCCASLWWVRINQSKWQVMKERKCETTIRKSDEGKRRKKRKQREEEEEKSRQGNQKKMTKTFLRLRFDLSDECLEYIEKRENEASRTNTNREFDQTHSQNINRIISFSAKFKNKMLHHYLRQVKFFVVLWLNRRKLFKRDRLQNITKSLVQTLTKSNKCCLSC